MTNQLFSRDKIKLRNMYYGQKQLLSQCNANNWFFFIHVCDIGNTWQSS